MEARQSAYLRVLNGNAVSRRPPDLPVGSVITEVDRRQSPHLGHVCRRRAAPAADISIKISRDQVWPKADWQLMDRLTQMRTPATTSSSVYSLMLFIEHWLARAFAYTPPQYTPRTFDLGLTARLIQSNYHSYSVYDLQSENLYGDSNVREQNNKNEAIVRGTAHLVSFDGLFDQVIGLGYMTNRNRWTETADNAAGHDNLREHNADRRQ